MNVYVDFLDHEHLDRDDVEDETDLDVLKKWHDELHEVGGELVAMIAAAKLADPSMATGMARKLGYVNIAKGWCKKRILALGGNLEYDEIGRRYNVLRGQLTSAMRSLEAKNKKIKALQAEIAELKDRVAA